MLRKTILSFIIFLFVLHAQAATVDTVSIYSKAMNKEYKCVVIKPDQYKSSAVPVVYLLHGFGGWYSNWITRVPELKSYSDKYQLMIVCPEGLNSWYLDSPVDSSYRFETYISEEVVNYIDEHYLTIKDRKARAITGLSMGGHGGLFLAFRNAEIFGACGSMSGGVDLNSSRNRFEIMKRIGDTITHATHWKDFSFINAVEQYPKDSLAIIIDCGLSDIFIKDNQRLHQKMLQLNIPHDYTERPGKHDWAYWKNSIQYHLLYFRNYFDKQIASYTIIDGSISGLISQSSTILKPGETIEITVGIDQFSSKPQLKILIGGSVIPLNEGGYAVYKTLAGGLGKHTIPVTIQFFNKVTGEEERISKNIQYTVTKD